MDRWHSNQTMVGFLDYIPLVTAVSSIAVPIAVVFIGIRINSSIESIKIDVAKEKDWQTFWASEFLENVRGFNLNLSNLAVLLQRMSQGDNDGSSEIKRITFELSRTNWVIRSMAFAAPTVGSKAVLWNDKIIERIGHIKSLGTINMDALLGEQKSFLECSMDAHREMLRLNRRAE